MKGREMRETKRYFKKWWMWVFLFIGMFLGSTGGVFLSCKNPGLKYYRNYTPDDYQYEPQNWCIVQDKRGVIYAANSGGIIEYDGVSWNSIKIPNLAALSIAIDGSGIIYVGGVNELGFLSQNSLGEREYISLVEYAAKSARNFGNAWEIHVTEEGVFFRTPKYVLRWDPQQKQMNILLEAKKGETDRINGSFTCNGKYFVKQMSVGIMQLENDSFKLIPGGETFSSIRKVFMIVSYDSSGQKLLIGTREKGFFIYDGMIIKPFPTEVDDYLNEKRVNHGIKLSRSGSIAMATLRGGLVIMDLQGKLKYLFTKDAGLLDNNVKYVYEDRQGNLWAALGNGISKIEYFSALSIYDGRTGLPGMIYSVVRQSNDLYVGTSEGLFYLASNANKFRPVPNMSSSCWSLLSTGDSVLAATSTGVYKVQTNTIQRIIETPSYVLLRSWLNSNRIWMGMRSTLGSLYLNSYQDKGKGQWAEECRYDKVDREIRTVVEDTKGNLWLGAVPSGVFKIVFPGNGNIRDYSLTRHDTSHQLPPGVVQVFEAAGHVMFGTKQGLFQFDKEKNIFIPDVTLGKEFSSGLLDVYRLKEDRNGVIWLNDKGRNYQAVPKPDGTYEINEKALARVPIIAQVNVIYPDPRENATWFASHKGLIRFDANIKKDYRHEYTTIIRKISVNGKPRFYDFFAPSITSNAKGSDKQTIPVFSYKDRNIHFDFAAPFFEDETRTTYSFILEGYEDNWTHLHEEVFKEYTNLDAGVYTFRVKGRNLYGNFGGEAAFRFKILPPWYRKWWAFMSYVFLFFLIIFLIVRWRSKKLKQEKKQLEQVIKERTKEINRKNQQLEKQTFLLQDQAEQLRELDHAKSRFFANISHEFRTPLTLIVGPLEQILSGQIPGALRNKLNLMQQNSHRLLTLINRLLDLSRIDSGKMKLRTAPQDIIPFLKGILASFEHLLDENELTLEFHTPGESIQLYFDREKLEEVFTNLLINAVKFTPPRGKITVLPRKVVDKEEDFPAGFLEVIIQDTGIGIPREQLAHIFDRFFQVESHERKHKGSGLGLALTRELVVLHHGKIDVNSRVGENSGTEFILRLPLGKDHLKPQEIIDPSKKEPGSPGPEPEILPETGEGQINLKKEGFEDVSIETERIEPGVKPGQEKQPRLKSTILVVEDNPGMRQFIRESIEVYYTVVEAEDGEEGRKKAQELMPDLVISDIMMPKMDGYELCQNLKTQFKTSHIPIILLTAKASESSKVEGFETGADDYIIKPFNMKLLLTRIKNLIDLRRQLQEKIQKQLRLQPDEINISSIDQRFITQLQEIIEKHISDEDLNVESLSEKMDISRVTLNKKIQALTGETAVEFIRSYRLKRAMQLLKENFGTVLDVALEVGFSNPSYFAKCFKEKFHQLPSEVLA
jgi:signal transduction histidine kinase/DNA-binding response OmpR family regulator/ligand-binding sensor domain-containing protein